MLSAQAVEDQEERLQQTISRLPEPQRLRFYKTVKSQLKDPDTYAVLNWCFVVGLHHLYLGEWLLAAIDIALFLLGFILLSNGAIWLGIGVWLALAAWEFWSLARSQLIVQHWNNQLYERVLAEM